MELAPLSALRYLERVMAVAQARSATILDDRAATLAPSPSATALNPGSGIGASGPPAFVFGSPGGALPQPVASSSAVASARIAPAVARSAKSVAAATSGGGPASRTPTAPPATTASAAAAATVTRDPLIDPAEAPAPHARFRLILLLAASASAASAPRGPDWLAALAALGRRAWHVQGTREVRGLGARMETLYRALVEVSALQPDYDEATASGTPHVQVQQGQLGAAGGSGSPAAGRAFLPADRGGSSSSSSDEEGSLATTERAELPPANSGVRLP